MGVVEARRTSETTRNGDKHIKTPAKYVGIDVHKDPTVSAEADGGREGEVRLYDEISSNLGAIEKCYANSAARHLRFKCG